MSTFGELLVDVLCVGSACWQIPTTIEGRFAFASELETARIGWTVPTGIGLH